MLVLKTWDFITNGGERRIYRHPVDAALCVKVPQPRGGTRPEETAAEVSYWQQLARQGCDFAHLPRFFGWTATNFGPGTIWQLIQGEDGSIAPSLPEALRRDLVAVDDCRAELLRFKTWSLAHRVVTRDLHPRNFVCRFERARGFRLYMVDGWGNSEFIPVSSWFSVLSRQKIERRWSRFSRDFDDLVARVGHRRESSARDATRGRRAA